MSTTTRRGGIVVVPPPPPPPPTGVEARIPRSAITSSMVRGANCTIFPAMFSPLPPFLDPKDEDEDEEDDDGTSIVPYPRSSRRYRSVVDWNMRPRRVRRNRREGTVWREVATAEARPSPSSSLLTMVMEASMVILFVIILLWREGTSDRRNKKKEGGWWTFL